MDHAQSLTAKDAKDHINRAFQARTNGNQKPHHKGLEGRKGILFKQQLQKPLVVR